MNYLEIIIKRDKEEAKIKIETFRRKFDLGLVTIGDKDPK